MPDPSAAPYALVALGLAVSAYVVLVRWAVWRWLAVLAALPVLLGLGALEDAGAGRVAVLVLVSAALVALCWRARPAAVVAGAVGGCAVALGLGLLASGARPGLGSIAAPGAGLVLALLVALAAGAGVGRATGSGLRAPALALALLPALAAVATADPMPALAWWPAAGALGLTALLRGRRGRAVARSQADDVDGEAAADFRARYGAPRLSPVVVVIAAYNEAEGLPKVLAGLPEEVCGLDADVLVVDDGSTDGTAEAAMGDSRAYTVACPANRGQGAALRLGYRLAREHGARFVVTTDADGQYDVADIPVVLGPLVADRADFVTGSRILGRQLTYDKVRRTGVHVFAWLASALVGRRLTDTSFGLRAMRVEVTATVTLNQPQYQASELLLGTISHGFRVLEVPGTMHVRSAGSTKKGRNLVYGRRYAGVMLGTWWREGCPRPAAEVAPALRPGGHAGR